MTDKFVNLHVHTEFSPLDGLGSPEAFLDRAAELGQPALATTDHGSLGGAYQFWSGGNTRGVKPIIGTEFYVAPSTRFEKVPIFWGTTAEGSRAEREQDVSGGGAYTHLTGVAATPVGVRNLFRLQERSYSEGFYRKPRIDRDLLEEHSDGLIILSGCPGGELSTRIRLGQHDEADEYVRRMKGVFGERFFIEGMVHGIDFEGPLNAALRALSQRHGVRFVPTGDAHFPQVRDAGAHDALLCLQTHATLEDERRFRFSGTGYHLSSRMEMSARGFSDEELDATLLVADMVGSYDSVFEQTVRMPLFNYPEWVRADDSDRNWWFAEETRKGLEQRLGVELPSAAYRERLNYEIDVITSCGFRDYFLVLSDIILWARREGIRVGAGRGSAGGSLVAYALSITDLDPIQLGLYFERFLNPERISPPDIDIDIQEDRRGEVLEFVRRQYGWDKVAHIGTSGTIGAKYALQDAARVLGFPVGTADPLKAKLPRAEFGRAPSLSEGRWDRITGDQSQVLELARQLEGTVRQPGVHAAGLLISPVPLGTVVPLWRPEAGEGPLVTAFDGPTIEKMGLVKYDFLGLRNLTVIDRTLSLLRAQMDSPELPTVFDDPAVFELLSSGETLGVFQLDGSGMQRLLKDLEPDHFEDISAVLALYRPGPMGAKAHLEYAARKRKGERSPAIHVDLDDALGDILGDTYGLIVYQEQVMRIVQKVAGYSLGRADILRKAMGKKDRELLDREFIPFKEGMKEHGYSDNAVEALWELLVPFADYSFNRAHSVGYAVTSYLTAYLKTYHPVEYMCALLSSVTEKPDKLQEYLDECQRMGVALLPPCVNRSEMGFSVAGGKIHYGLSAISGVGESAGNSIVSGQPYADLSDFLARSGTNSAVCVALAKAGALDSVCASREGLVSDLKEVCGRASRTAGLAALGDLPLVPVRYPVQPLPVNSALRQTWEDEVLGQRFTILPVEMHLERPLDASEWQFVGDLLARHPGNQTVTVTGAVKIGKLTTISVVDSLRSAFAPLGISIKEG